MPHQPDAVRRLALLGGESSGKTTLAVALAARLGTVWVAEFGRELWEERRTTLTVDELVHVARVQVAREDELAGRAKGWLICDTTPLTTLQYCLHDHGHAPPELVALARRRYDVTVLCEPDFGFVQDGCRRDDDFRSRQHAWTLAQLAEQGVQALHVAGSIEQRVAHVLGHLAGMPAPQAGVGSPA
jgi:HTH-type transcriptional regulator, transcriptional repressor of NAD biosynthesis genes